MNIAHYEQLLDIVPPDSSPTQAFLLMQMERIQNLESQLAQAQYTISNLVRAQCDIIEILHMSSQENTRFLHNTEQGIVSVGQSHISDLLESSNNISQKVSELRLKQLAPHQE